MTNVIKKPRYGEPCNGCGQCCAAVLCPLAKMIFGRTKKTCPALTKTTDGKRGCGLCMSPRLFAGSVPSSDADLSKAAMTLIGAGLGCDGVLVGEPHPFMARMRLRAAIKRYRPYVEWAKSVWLGGNNATT